MHHEKSSAFNPFQKEMFTYLVEGFKVSVVSKLITWEMFVHTKGIEVYVFVLRISKIRFLSALSERLLKLRPLEFLIIE